ncbi:MAG: VWA domain-containing protein, partial [bacterium]|nr:VWA domain-containing protein [bacterium]
VLVDNPWGVLSFAYQYLNQGFDDDPDYSGLFSNELLSFMISSDFLVTDKWNKNCTANNDPISFNKLPHTRITLSGTFSPASTATLSLAIPDLTGTNEVTVSYDGTDYTYGSTITDTRISGITPANGTTTPDLLPIYVEFARDITDMDVVGNYTTAATTGTITGLVGDVAHGFDSTDYDITEKYIIRRLINLDANPTILYTTPPEGTVLSGLTPVEVVYSKLLVDAAGTAAEFTPGGAAGGSLTILDASYTGVEKIENVVNLTMGGTLGAGSLSITMTAAVTDTEGNALTDNSIVYSAADTEAPVITQFDLGSGTPTADPAITFTLNGTDNVAITHWVITESATPPAAGESGWLANKPTGYTLSATYGTKEVYAWAKDAANNVSAVNSDSHFTVQYEDTAAPQITQFNLTSSTPTDDANITFTLTGTDNVAITHWVVNESATPLDPADASWIALSAPTGYTLSAGYGTKLVYAWARDEAGNVSALTPGSWFQVEYEDTEAPQVTQFALTSGDPTTIRDIAFDLTGSDNVSITHWMINESSTQPGYSDTEWVAGAAPTVYTMSAGYGTKHVYAWAKDAANNVSSLISTSNFEVEYEAAADTEIPEITQFDLTSSTPTTNPVIDVTLNGTDNTAITHWIITESATQPLAVAAGWLAVKPTNYTLTGAFGTIEVYAWAKDAANNVSIVNANSHFSVEYKEAFTPPLGSLTIDGIIDAAGTTYGFIEGGDGIPRRTSDLRHLTVTFTEAVTGANNIANYNLAQNYVFEPGDTPSDFALVLDSITPNPSDPAEYTLHYKGSPALGSITISVNGSVTASSGAALADDTVTVATQRPRDIVIVVDNSGSMGMEIGIDGGTEKPKIDYLRDAIPQFIDKWDPNATNGDRVGMVYYHSEAEIKFNLEPLLDHVEAVKTIVTDEPANDLSAMTALGAGLSNAINMLKDAGNADTLYTGPSEVSAEMSRKQFIIVFADGEQNLGPDVEVSDDGSSFIINTSSINTYTVCDLPRCPVDTFDTVTINQGDSNNIPVYTIGIGDDAYSHWQGLLQDIAAITGGEYRSYPQIHMWPDTDTSLEDYLENFYKGNSPQVIYRNRGEITETRVTETFVLDKAVNKATISLSWPGNTPLRFTLKKDGVTIPSYQKYVQEENYVVATLVFPYYIRPKMEEFPYKEFLSQKEISREATAKKKSPGERKRYDGRKKITPGEFQKPVPGSIKPDYLDFVSTKIEPEGTWEVEIERVFTRKAAAHFVPGIAAAASASAASVSATPVKPSQPDFLELEPSPYYLSIIGDEKNLSYEYHFPRDIVRIDERILLGLKVFDKNIPISSLYQAQITVTRPEKGIGSIAAFVGSRLTKADLDAAGAITEDKTPDNDKKIRVLLKNKLVSAGLLKQVTQTIDLEQQWKNYKNSPRNNKGEYRTLFEDTKIPGVYKVDYTIRGMGSHSGLFERKTTRNFVVAIEPDTSTGIKARFDKKQALLRVFITPRDSERNILGPGYGNTVSCKFGDRKPDSVTDNLDGSYTVTFSRVTQNELETYKVSALMKGAFGREPIASDTAAAIIKKTRKQESWLACICRFFGFGKKAR